MPPELETSYQTDDISPERPQNDIAAISELITGGDPSESEHQQDAEAPQDDDQLQETAEQGESEQAPQEEADEVTEAPQIDYDAEIPMPDGLEAQTIGQARRLPPRGEVMSDIAKKLRQIFDESGFKHCREAADEIESLQARIKELSSASSLGEVTHQRDKLQARIAELENPWIPVSERLPIERDIYFVYRPQFRDEINQYCPAYFDPEKQEWLTSYGATSVTHWMPLPLPSRSE